MDLIHFICTLGIFTLFNVIAISESEKLQCMDEDNKPVDWFILYKLPTSEKPKGSTDESYGKKYLYMSSSTIRSPGWKTPKKLISDPDSMPGNTLKPLYATGRSGQIWVLYNDQPPSEAKVKGTCGHSKGVVAANREGGFWMVHSVPKFPDGPSKGQYSYPESGSNNGQTFLCITMGSQEIEKVAAQLQMNEVGLYYNFYDESLVTVYPKLVSIAQGTAYKLDTDQSKVDIKTVANNVFTSFAKSRKFSKDLYEDLVAPSLLTSMSVETWRNGAGSPLPSDCSTAYKVMNVENVNLCVKKDCDSFSYTKDHSKWAVSIDDQKPYICIGDVNRALSQGKRGGGTVCMNNAKVWKAFYSAVTDVEPCPRPRPLAKTPSLKKSPSVNLV
ncbi:plancitoxin-1 [Nilaparvata lugens]|uniref:plancitoxin-1 n=1 Tax=Nilaparvata lugens TaxID=108931 RepID=UPI00193D774C|nr:plancitoxin-1 [Nilaparvata lugens]